MKKLFVIMMIGLAFACNHNKKLKQYPEVVKFESILGKKESKELTKIVREFEVELTKYYGVKATEEAYRKYFNEIKKSGKIEIKEFPLRDIVYRLNKSSVRDEIWLKPDSCWRSDQKLHCRYSYRGSSFNYTYYLKDEIEIKPSDYIILNKDGNFFKGLESANSDIYVKAYLDNIKVAGIMSPTLLSDAYSKPNVDYSNYFVKRLTLVEILLSDYKW